jgi:hypothetical protein
VHRVRPIQGVVESGEITQVPGFSVA